MRHGDDRARVVGQVAFEPRDAFGVEVIGGLVQQQQVGPLEQKLAQGHAPLLAAGEYGDVGVAGRQVHGVHGDLDMAVELPGARGLDLVLQGRLAVHELFHGVGVVGDLGVLVAQSLELVDQGARGGDGLLDVALHILLGVEVRLLLQQADGVSLGQLSLAVELLVSPGHDAQQRALAGAVATQHADLGAGVEGKPDVFENLALAEFFGERGDLVDIFLGHEATSTPRGEVDGSADN